MKSSALIVSVAAVVIVGGLGAYVLFGKSSATTPDNAAANTSTDATKELITTPSDTANSSGAADATTGTTQTQSSAYKDGTYTGTGSYETPETTEDLTVTLTLKNDIVTDVSFTGTQHVHETRQYQAQFASGYKQFVVGKNIDDISVSRVSGSSLTSGGFMAALAQIKAEAKA